MLTRRVALFILGIWIGGSALVGMLVLQNPVASENQFINPASDAKTLIAKMDLAQAKMLLHNFVGEQNRAYLANWGLAQLILGASVVILCAFSAKKQWIPLLMTLAMTFVVAFQYVFTVPELAFLGRNADFLAQPSPVLEAQITTTATIFGITEGVKLVLGGILISYLFAAQNSSSSRKRRRSTDSEVEAIRPRNIVA